MIKMMKFILNLLFWIALVAYYFISLGFVSDRRNEQICTALKISVTDSARSRFITANDIHQIVENRNHKIVGLLYDSINISKIERLLRDQPPIKQAVVYKTIDGTVHINVTQRTPVVRIINRFGESFYFDEDGDLMKHSNNYCTHVLVANGYINLRPDQKNYNVLASEAPFGKRNIMRELYDLANYINADKFWSAQIQQIYVNENGDFELIPLVGSHVIVFGNFYKPEAKFSKLMSFYRNGLNVKGWNSYDVINLKYEGQIVGTRKK